MGHNESSTKRNLKKFEHQTSTPQILKTILDGDSEANSITKSARMNTSSKVNA